MGNKNPKSKPSVLFFLYFSIMAIVIALTVLFWVHPYTTQPKPKETTYLEFKKYVKNKKVKSVEISLNEKDFTFTLKNDKSYITQNPKYENFKKDLLESGVEVKEGKDKSHYTSYAFNIMSIGIMVLFFMTLQKQVKGEDGILSKKKKNKPSVKFDDIAGLNEVKQDLQTIVSFLKEPQKYKEAGAKLPKGVMLYGPPGTGKTMLAKAIAGEAGVEFLAAVGSEFDERYVGVGAQRIRKLFSDAKKKAPCIIFIDEIDALGGKRTSSNSSSDRQSVNQLLSEMDGFSTDDDIIVVAATNRLEDLDSALIRPGRFDSHFSVSLPINSSDRRKIIDIYAKNKKIDESVNLDILAKETLGCSPADIETILNESAIIAVKENNGIINKQNIDDAFFKHIMKGHKKENMERKQEEIKKTAYHEAGHALLGILCGQDITKVTIIPSTSGAGGVTFFNNEKLGMYSKTELENRIMVLYAGRAAESILCGDNDITTGASNDIKTASDIINNMITKYGMSELGLVDMEIIEHDKQAVLDIASRISSELYTNSCSILRKNEKTLDKIAEKLMEEETLDGNEIRKIVGKI